MRGTILKKFIYTIIIYGFLLIYITPPMQVPDENTHFLNSYAIAHLDIFPETNGEKIGRKFPLEICRFIENYQAFFLGGEEALKIQQQQFETYGSISWSQWQYEIYESINRSQQQFVEYWNADTSPIAYIAPAFGMWLAENIKIVPTTPYNLLIAGRIANLVMFVFLASLTLSLTPILKKTILLLLLMPSTVSLAASLSYDAIIIGTTLLLFSLVLKSVCSEKKISVGEIMLFIFIAVVLLSVKQAYFPLLLTAFCISIDKFPSKRAYIGTIVFCLFFAVILYIPYKLQCNTILSLAKQSNVNYMGQPNQVKYIMAHLYKIPELIVNSFLVYGSFYVNSFFGNLGRLEILFIPWYSCMYLFILLITILSELKIAQKINVTKKLIFAFAIICSVVLIFVGTYIIWTTNTIGIGADYVDGVQGRYFIMLVPFVCILFCYNCSNKYILHNKFVRQICTGLWKHNIHLLDLAMLYVNVCLILSVLLILLRFWI